MLKIKVVSATQLEGGFEPIIKDLPIVRSAERLGLDLDLIKGNSRGLSEVYNEAIDKYHGSYDVLICVHDDVLLSDCFLHEKIESGLKYFDIMGVAGAADLNIVNPPNKNHPICWHNSDRRGWAGAVEHIDDKDKFFVSYYGKTPRRVVTLDGLFFAINLKTIGDVRFDEQFKFHFYDMDFSISCHKAGLKLGVINIFTTHMSQGAGINEPIYRELEEKFLKKWKNK